MRQGTRFRGITAPGWMIATAVVLAAGGCAPPPESPPTEVTVAQETPAPAEKRSRSTRAGFGSVEIVLKGAVRNAHEVRLGIAFENPSQDSYGLTQDLRGGDFRLIDAAGNSYPPIAVSESLEQIEPTGGFPPKTAKVGEVSFPLPQGGEPYELQLPDFGPIHFHLQELAELSLPPAPDLPGDVDEGPSPPSSPPDRELLAELDRLLAAQAQAIERFDFNGYLDTFIPEVWERQRQLFQRLRQVQFAEYRLRIAPNGEIRAGGSDDTIRAAVELRYRLEELPEDNPFFHSHVYAFSRRDGRWLVREIHDEPNRPPFWRRGELELHRTHHFLIYTQPGLADDLIEVAKEAEAGYATLYQRGLPLAPRYVAHLIASEDGFRRLVGRRGVLGAALSRFNFQDGEVFVDSRAFYINGTLFSKRRRRYNTSDARRTTITHELVHLALAESSRPYTPPWLKEGAAVYFSGNIDFDANRDLVRKALDRMSLTRLTQANTLGEHDTRGQQIAWEYLFSGNVVAYLIETFGTARFLDFYRSYAGVSNDQALEAIARLGGISRIIENTSAALAAMLTEEALQEHFQLSLTELDATVKQWLWLRYR